MFAVCAADNGIFADLDIIGNKSALTTAPSATSAPGIRTLSITLAPVPTLAPVNRTEF